MPRIRSIKPEVHLDEELWDLEVETGLPIFRAFTGLWNHSDREGRFKWRPRALKAGILPYSDDDFSEVLDALVSGGFVVKYTSGGKEFGWVRTFTQHQVVNGREAASILPAPPISSTNTDTSTGESRVATQVSRVPEREVHARGEGKGREGKGSVVDDTSRDPNVAITDAEIAEVYQDVTGKTDLPLDAQVKGRLLDVMIGAVKWANGHGGLPAVRAQLEAMQGDKFLKVAGWHTVLDRLGTMVESGTRPDSHYAKAPRYK